MRALRLFRCTSGGDDGWLGVMAVKNNIVVFDGGAGWFAATTLRFLGVDPSRNLPFSLHSGHFRVAKQSLRSSLNELVK